MVLEARGNDDDVHGKEEGTVVLEVPGKEEGKDAFLTHQFQLVI